MNTFCVYSLFVVIMAVNQVRGGSESDNSTTSEDPTQPVENLDEHDCDPLAVNTAKDERRTGPDAENQVFPIEAFLRYNKSNYYVARATPVPIKSAGPTSPRWCHVPFFNRDCGPLHYGQELAQNYDPKLVESLKNIRLKTTFVAMNLENGKAILYEMDVEGTNSDDYIFQWVPDTPINAHEIGDNGVKTPIPIPENVLNKLKSEFALNRIGLVESSETYKDGDDDRSVYDDDDDDDDVFQQFAGGSGTDVEEETRPEGVGTSGTKDTHDADAEQKEEDDTNDDKFDMKNRLYMIYISCDGQSIWAAYNRSIVDADDEASHAESMDRQIEELQELTVVLRNNDPFVKSVSTYMPERFDQYIPKGPETNVEVFVS